MKNHLGANSIPLHSRLIDAVQAIKENRNRCVVVCSDQKVVGVISEGDVMRALLQGADIHAPVEDWVSQDFKFLSAPDLGAALDLMRKYGITMVPVLDESFSLLGVVTLMDVLKRVELRGE